MLSPNTSCNLQHIHAEKNISQLLGTQAGTVLCFVYLATRTGSTKMGIFQGHMVKVCHFTRGAFVSTPALHINCRVMFLRQK